eukprot:PhF_6_TR1535/c0_g1_i1/m.2806
MEGFTRPTVHPSLVRYDLPGLVFLRIVNKVCASGKVVERIVLVINSRLVVCDVDNGTVKRDISIASIADITLQGEYILIGVPTEHDLLFKSKPDLRNPEHFDTPTELVHTLRKIKVCELRQEDLRIRKLGVANVVGNTNIFTLAQLNRTVDFKRPNYKTQESRNDNPLNNTTSSLLLRPKLDPKFPPGWTPPTHTLGPGLEGVAESGSVTFPADGAFWDAFIKACQECEVASHPPYHRVVSTANAGSVLHVNRMFCSSFVAWWKETFPHQIELRSHKHSLKANVFLTAGFWRHVVSNLLTRPNTGDLLVRHLQSETEYITTLEVWSSLVLAWENIVAQSQTGKPIRSVVTGGGNGGSGAGEVDTRINSPRMSIAGSLNVWNTSPPGQEPDLSALRMRDASARRASRGGDPIQHPPKGFWSHLLREFGENSTVL